MSQMFTLKTPLLTIFLSIQPFVTFSQERFKVVERYPGGSQILFDLIDEDGNLIRTLDKDKYFPISLNQEGYGYFAIFGFYEKSGWYAIDANENIIFQVYNTSFGEPSPDNLIENKIRIVDKMGLIGYANQLGEIIIEPQFEIASSFHNNKAIIGSTCKKEPIGEHDEKGGCEHFSITCQQNGYINTDGEIRKIGDYTFEEIMEEIGWQDQY